MVNENTLLKSSGKSGCPAQIPVNHIKAVASADSFGCLGPDHVSVHHITVPSRIIEPVDVPHSFGAIHLISNNDRAELLSVWHGLVMGTNHPYPIGPLTDVHNCNHDQNRTTQIHSETTWFKNAIGRARGGNTKRSNRS